MVTAVLDTNVLISGTFWLGPPKEVLHRAKVGFFRAVISPTLLAELQVMGHFDERSEEKSRF